MLKSQLYIKNIWASSIKNSDKIVQELSTHMLQTPKVVCQPPEQDQWEMNGSCFCEENRISLVQASQIPVETI